MTKRWDNDFLEKRPKFILFIKQGVSKSISNGFRKGWVIFSQKKSKLQLIHSVLQTFLLYHLECYFFRIYTAHKSNHLIFFFFLDGRFRTGGGTLKRLAI